MATLSITAIGSRIKQFFAPFPSEHALTPCPDYYRCQINLTYPDCNIACVDYIQELILDKIIPPENTAAIIIEPIQGVSGFIVPPGGYSRVASKAALDAIVEDKLMERAERLGEVILARLLEMKQRYEITGDVRGKGLMAGVPLW